MASTQTMAGIHATVQPRRKHKVLIMAGGTGGHVIPALAVAKQLANDGVEVEWLGTLAGIENKLVPQAGIALHYIEIQGIRGKGIFAWMTLPFLLSSAILQARKIIKTFRPDVVLGMGGFASGPGAIVARLMKIPLVIHEQNAVAGTTNRWLARIASVCLQAFPGTLPKAKVVGNPVRSEIFSVPPPDARYKNRNGIKKLLVLGGSLGALRLNQLVPAAMALFKPDERPDVWHQCGKANFENTREIYQSLGLTAKVEAFVEDMAAAYGWADLVICRSGAITVSELAAAGVASVLVPFPYAIDDHQTKNALWLVENDAAVIRQQNQLTPESLHTVLSDLLNNGERLRAMAVNARKLALPDAANQVADCCLALAS